MTRTVLSTKLVSITNAEILVLMCPVGQVLSVMWITTGLGVCVARAFRGTLLFLVKLWVAAGMRTVTKTNDVTMPL